VVNVPPDVTELALDAGNPKVPKLPKEALQTRTDFGAPGYGGPCPPLGDHPHRYLFTVFAVGVDSLPVTADTSAAIIGFQLNFNTLAKAAIMGLYKSQPTAPTRPPDGTLPSSPRAPAWASIRVSRTLGGAASGLCRFWVRGHRSEIMFGVLVVVLCPDRVAG